MSEGLQEAIASDPIYWGAVAEIGRSAIKENPNELEHLFWQQPFRKDKAPSGIEYYAAVGLATMKLRGARVGLLKSGSPYGRVRILTPQGALPDKEEQANKKLLDSALQNASAAHYEHHGRHIDFEVEIDTNPPDDGSIVMSEVECTRQFLRGDQMVAQDVLVTDVECRLEIGYVATVHTMLWPLLRGEPGLARFPYNAPTLMLAVQTNESNLKKVLNERLVPKNIGALPPAAKHFAALPSAAK